MKRQVVFWALLLMTYIVVDSQTIFYKEHTIQAGETLYSLARIYGTSVDDIRTANPQLGEVYRIGETIRIPQLQVTIPKCKQSYIVKKKETLYSISRQFGLTVDDLLNANPILREKTLKKNMEICIPYSAKEIEDLRPKSTFVMLDEVKVGVFLPYGLSQEVKTKEACTMIDFYEGVLLSVQDMKAKGIPTTIYSYDEADIMTILQDPEIKTLNIIIGPKNSTNVSVLSRFCKANNITLVVPISSQDNLVSGTPYIFQVNTSLSSRYDHICEQFATQYAKSKIIFVSQGEEDNQIYRTVQLQKTLDKKGISYNKMSISELEDANTTDGLLSSKPIVIVPMSSTQKGFEAIVNCLDKQISLNSKITLFGYTDWQAFASKYKAAFSKYHCTFFTSFYNNPDDIKSINFNARFRNQFKRDQFNTYPRYGMLGYDTANFFILNYYEQSNKFYEKIPALRSKGALQNPMQFSKLNPTSGYINNALMKVTYGDGGTISVTQY